MQLSCRFYKNHFPEIDDIVMVCVNEIEDMGVYVTLLEYNNRQGMILLTELSRRRIRSVNKLIRIGRNEAVLVVRVDPEKGYIDLSKRRMSPPEIASCEEKYSRGKTVHCILGQTAETLGIKTNEEFEELYEKTAWYYDEKYKKPGVAYDIFTSVVRDENVLDDCPIDQNAKQALINSIRRRLGPTAVKCRASVEVACYGYAGIDAVKTALKEGLTASTEDIPIKINLIAPPLYVLTVTCFNRIDGIAILNTAMSKIKESIEKLQGIYKLKMEAKVVTDDEDKHLQKTMDDFHKDNEEVPGDDDDDDDDSSESEDNNIEGILSDEDKENLGSIERVQKNKTKVHEVNDDD